MSGDDLSPDLSNLTDPRALRALTHPVRIALIEALMMAGELTATQAGEQLGESATTCSFHLRQLARYGFVEEAGGGKGRARPWRLASPGWNITPGDDLELELAGSALMNLIRGRQAERYQTWLQTRARYPLEWRDAAGDGQWLFYLTAAELKELNDELFRLLMPRFTERADPANRPPGTVPVALQMITYPLEMPRDAGSREDGSK